MSITPTKHSRKYSPSKSATWINCPLSTVLNDSASNEVSEQALFGTECHELGAALISKSLKLVDYDHEAKSINELIEGLALYSQEMQEIADHYADFVVGTVEYERRRSNKDPLMCVETYLSMDFAEDAGGTLDFGMITDYNGGTLTVIDLKTGRLKVQAYDGETGRFNSQLGIYALYLYKAFKDIYPVKNVRLVVYQPVIGNTNDYEMPIEELLKFEKEILIPAVERTKVASPVAKSGSYCKWCAGKAVCRERAETNISVVADASKEPATMTDAEIEQILPKLDDLISFAEDVKEFCLKKALNGHKWLNYKLVHGKTTRKIADEDAVVRVCKEAGIDPYAARKVAGVTELTKRIGKDRFNKLIGEYITKQEGAIQLVPESDSREEVNIKKEGDK